MVTGPMPRKPNATRPNANTGAVIGDRIPERPMVDTPYAPPISSTITMPIQYAEKLPAVRPDSTLSDAPPSRDDVTTSRTWRDSVDVNTLTTSGMIAPASVPKLMMVDSSHHTFPSPMSRMRKYETA